MKAAGARRRPCGTFPLQAPQQTVAVGILTRQSLANLPLAFSAQQSCFSSVFAAPRSLLRSPWWLLGDELCSSECAGRGSAACWQRGPVLWPSWQVVHTAVVFLVFLVIPLIVPAA